MTAQKLTKYQWDPETELTSAAMTAIGTTINKLIDDVNDITPAPSGITMNDVNGAIDSYYHTTIEGAIGQLNTNLGLAVDRITTLENGSGHESGEDYDIDWVKDDIGTIFRYMGITKNEGTGVYNYALDLGSLVNVDNLGQAIAALQTSANTNGDAITALRAGIIAGYDDNGDPVYKFDPAQIILAINSSGNTIGQIHADYIELDGYVTTSQLAATNARIDNLNIPNEATIKSAVISDIEAGNVTVTGDLHYNKLLGNVEDVSSGQIQANTYFAMFTGPATAGTYPAIALPQNPSRGQTIFIGVGSKCFMLYASNTIKYYKKEDLTGNQDYGIVGPLTANANDQINVFECDWNGVIEFIYTGTEWHQLIHNIRV